MTKENSSQTAFRLNSELVENINSMNFENLKNNFGINSALFEEIKEELFDYFETEDLPKLKILETNLFTSDNKETELTLHTEFNNNTLRFKLIEVM
ncbi:hypothetical protein [Flavobacterium ajazii]|uniref:hypothetical protein n=1 Tax=Flavobacterium ajazii TaxID=2692318 RepID=UPI0013D43A23|nr:hypothetical protein [Flavobacterium ajazii]